MSSLGGPQRKDLTMTIGGRDTSKRQAVIAGDPLPPPGLWLEFAEFDVREVDGFW